MVTKFRFFWVECGNQQWFAWVSQRDTFTFNYHITLSNNVQQDVGCLFIKEINIIDVKNTSVGFRQKSRRKYSFSCLNTFLKIGTTNETIFHNIQWYLYERARNDICFALCEGSTSVGKISFDKVIQTEFPLWINVEWRSLDDLNWWKELVKCSCHDRLGSTFPTRNNDSSHSAIHCCQQQGLFDRILSYNHGKWEWTTTKFHQFIVFDPDRSNRGVFLHFHGSPSTLLSGNTIGDGAHPPCGHRPYLWGQCECICQWQQRN
mmetsp:Transcript_34217/g.48629  ORF Transcript_34217/g.48629 Transcript_34217/m.48629 type:complete len:262 (-) Transcript_34217:47-832(-)